MGVRHAYISTPEAQPGMRLARLLRNVSHHRLFQLAPGTELTDEVIRQISARGVQCLVVEESDTRAETQLTLTGERIRSETDHIFRNADLRQPAIARLYGAVIAYRSLHE